MLKTIPRTSNAWVLLDSYHFDFEPSIQIVPTLGSKVLIVPTLGYLEPQYIGTSKIKIHNPTSPSGASSQRPQKILRKGLAGGGWSFTCAGEDQQGNSILVTFIGLIRNRGCHSSLVIITLGLQMAQSRYYLQTFDPKVGTICILGALGLL